MRLPRTEDLHRFCAVDGWTIRATARGKAADDHTRYQKVLADGTVLITKVSHGRKTIGDRDLFTHILRTQRHVTAEQFWAAVDDGTPPARPGLEPEPPRDAIPLDLAMNLLRKVGLTQERLASMTKEEAVALWQRWLTNPPPK